MPGRSKLAIGLTQRGVDEGAVGTTRTRADIEKYYRKKKQFQYKKNDRGKIVKIPMLTGGQAKLDKNKNNKIDAEDFKILRKEKSPKPIKAKRGDFMKRRLTLGGLDPDKAKAISKSSQGTTAKSAKSKTFSGYQKVFKTGVSAGDKAKATSTIIGVKPKLPKPSKASSIARRALRGVKATYLGRRLLPVVAAGVAAQQYLKSKMKKKKEEPKKKMGGGMMKVPGYSSGTTDPVKTFGPNTRRPPERRLKRVAQQQRRRAPRTGLGALGESKKDVKPNLKVVIVGGSKKSLTGQ